MKRGVDSILTADNEFTIVSDFMAINPLADLLGFEIYSLTPPTVKRSSVTVEDLLLTVEKWYSFRQDANKIIRWASGLMLFDNVSSVGCYRSASDF